MNTVPTPDPGHDRINDTGDHGFAEGFLAGQRATAHDIDPETVRAVARLLARLGYDIDPARDVPALADRINEFLAEGVPQRKPIVQAAIDALEAWNVENMEQAATLLGMWARRSELTEAEVAEVLAVFEPAQLIEPPECEPWCNGEHRGEQAVPEIRECVSDPAWVPDHAGKAIAVQARRVFDRQSGRMTREPVVSVEDLDFTPDQAWAVATAMERTANLIEGKPWIR